MPRIGGEIIVYSGEENTGSTLTSAIDRLHKEVRNGLFTATDLDLTTNGVGIGNCDNYATGISGKSPLPSTGENVSWTIRWDWDEDKGSHVNLSIKRGAQTQDYAFLEAKSKYTLESTTWRPDSLYLETIRKFTTNTRYCGRRVNAGNRLEAAKQGKRLWCQAYVPMESRRNEVEIKAALKLYYQFAKSARQWRDFAEDAQKDLKRQMTDHEKDLSQYEIKQSSTSAELENVRTTLAELTGEWERHKAKKDSYKRREEEMERLEQQLRSGNLSQSAHERTRRKVHSHVEESNEAVHKYNTVNRRRNNLLDQDRALVKSYNRRLNAWDDKEKSYKKRAKDEKARLERCVHGVHYPVYQAVLLYDQLKAEDLHTSLESVKKLKTEATQYLVGPKRFEDGKECYLWVIRVQQSWKNAPPSSS